jgi:hypothetical protein
MHRFTRVAGLAAILALSVTAVAQAHPGFYSVNARVAFTYEEQTVTVSGGAGTFKPSANAASVAFNATAAQVEQALWADPAIGYDNVDVTGPAGGPYVIRWTGTLAGKVVAPIAPVGAGGATAVVSQGQEGGTPVTPATDPTGVTQATMTQYVIANDGYTYQFTETNNLGGTGFLNLKFLPGAYRATLPPVQWFSYPGLATGIQAHATCTGVPALEDPANILAAQEGDPFFRYIPWQKTSNHVGGDADPAKWIAVVKAATGVDLSTLNTVAEFTSACTGLGGTYVPADTRTATATALISDAVAPLNTQIVDLTSSIAAITGQKNAADAALSDALVDAAAAKARLRLGTRKVTAALSGVVSLTKTTTVKLTGPAGAAVRVRMLLTQAEATRLHLRSPVLARKTQTLGAGGTATARLSIASAARKAAKRASKKAITIEAVLTDGFASIRAR